MGVMSCYRNGCERVMCDTYVESCGYICNDCQREFEDYLKNEGLNPQTEGQIERELRKFMETEKDFYKEGGEMSVNEFFKKHTRD